MLLDIAPHVLYPLLFATGLGAGMVDAIAGGGGLISLPVLLGIGLPPQLALGTNKLQSSVGASIATYSYYRRGWLTGGTFYRGLLFCFLGAMLGAVASQLLSSAFLNKVIPILLVLILLYTVFSPRLGHEDAKARMQEKSFFIIVGTLLGFYDGFFGPGVGSFWLFFLVFLLGYNFLKATAYTKLFNLTTNLTALACFIIGGNVDYRLGLTMAAGQIIGSRVGAHLAMSKGSKLVRPIFMSMVFLTILSLIHKNYPDTSRIFQLFSHIGIVPAIFVIMAAFVSIGIYLFRRKTAATPTNHS